MNSFDIITDIKNWVKEYATSNNINSLVVGVSGGIDSALVSTICAMTEIKTYCVLLPLNQKKEQTNRGLNHINWLKSKYSNVELVSIDLTDTFSFFKTNLPEEFSNNELALANSKSRFRMVALYQIAQSKNGIVVGTGNKVEDFGVGFFTKYGDGGVDISPIADLYKTQVYQLAKELKIIKEILIARPTDGLWDDDRNDETQIGASYDELEWAMEYLELNNNFELTDRQKEIIKIYKSFNEKNKHKMISIPIFKIK